MSRIQAWLESEGLGKYAETFVAQDISVHLLPELSDADLMALGVASLGDRRRLLKAIATARSASAPASRDVPRALSTTPGSALASAPAPLDDMGERRHATAVFSDLAGYTALGEAFDPEEVESVIARVRREAIAVVERHGGHVNQFVGDEVIAIFGVPVARRDDPQRAVRAALELHRAVDNIAAGLIEKFGRVLSMHTGIQSGLVDPAVQARLTETAFRRCPSCRLPLPSWRHGQAEKHHHRLIEPHQVLVIESSNVSSDLGLRDGRDLVHHQPAGQAQPIAVVRFDGQAEQRRFRGVRGERTDGQGIGAIEAVVLDDDDGARLTRVVLAPCDRPDLTTSHSSPRSDTASMNA